MHQTIKTCLERKHNILLSPACSVYQVCHSVGRCVKYGSCSSSLERKFMDSINGISYYLNKCQTLSNTSHMTFLLSGRQCIGAHALRVQHSQLLRRSRLSCSGTMPPNSPEPSALITKFRESYSSVSMSRESKRLKKARTE